MLVITAPLSQVKSPYAHSGANPNQITQSLIATLAGLQVPFLCTETHELGEELVASYLYQVHLGDHMRPQLDWQVVNMDFDCSSGKLSLTAAQDLLGFVP